GIDLFRLNRIVKFCAQPFHLFFPQPIDRHVHHNPIDPRIKGRAPAKAFNRLPRFYEAILSQIPGVLLIMDHVVNQAEYPCSIERYYHYTVPGVTGLTTLQPVHFRHIGLSQSRFRLNNWTELAPYHSPALAAAESPSPLTTVFPHKSEESVTYLEE